jgi:acyl carrier protein
MAKEETCQRVTVAFTTPARGESVKERGERMGTIETFLAKNFMKLPLGARVVAYFILLGLFVYLVLAPRFVNGDVVAERDGAVRPYRGVELKTSLEGRTLKFRTNEDGVWSIPLLARFPSDLRVAVKNVDGDEWMEVVLAKGDIWSSFWSPNFRITIESAPPKASVRSVDSRNTWQHWALLDALFSPAYAGQLVLPDIPGTVTQDPNLKKAIALNVQQTVAKALKQPSADKTKNFPLLGAGAPTYIDRIDIVRKLEKDYKLLIPDEHWQSMGDSQELAEYIYRRKLLEQSNPERYKIKQSYDWTTIENAGPPTSQPKFRSLDTVPERAVR